jgi:hypothetical protein
MWPWLVWWQICAVGEAEIDTVEGDDQVLLVVNSLEGANNAWLRSNLPYEILMRDAIAEAHALFVNDWKVVFVHGGEILAVKAKIADEH